MNELIVSRRPVYFFLAMVAVVAMYFFTGTSSAYAVGQTPDDTWATNGTVFDTALSEDKSTLYVGGRFTVARENPPGEEGAKVAVKNLAAFDTATGEVIRTWRPQATNTDGTGGVVRSIEVEGNKVYVGGNFTSVNGQPRTSLAALDAIDGSLDSNIAPTIETNDPAITPTVYTILTDGSKLYIGGNFNFVSGKWTTKLAALDASTGTLDNGWRPRVTREVFDLEFSTEKQTIFVIGRFRSVTGSDGTQAVRETVARLHTDTGNVHPWAIPAGTIEDPQTGWEGLVTSDRLYAGFGDKGPNYVAAFRLDNGDTGNLAWRYSTRGDVYSLAMTPDGKRLFFGGHSGLMGLRQTVCGDKALQGLASVNPANGQIYCDWIPQLQPEFDNGNGPWDMAITGDNQLWVGGGFTHVSGVNQTNLARFTFGSVQLDTTINSAPPAVTRSTSASFAFSSEPGAGFQCSLDNAAFGSCDSPKVYSGLSNGRHTFKVRAIDTALNTDPTPASLTWRVDTVRPSGKVVINGGKASTTSRKVTLRTTATDPAPASGVASMRFRNAGTTAWTAWQAYATSKAWALTAGAGKKTVYAQYRDRAGNVSAIAADSITYKRR